VDGQKYIGQGKSKKLARIDAATCALRDFIQFKDQQIKNGVIGMTARVVNTGGGNNSTAAGNASGGGSSGAVGSVTGSNGSSVGSANNALNNNYDYDFTSDDHIENTGILNSNNSNIKENDTVNSINQNHTLEDENLVKKIQQSLECSKKTKTENHAWLSRLQS
jgi:hypothetical protein